MNRRAFLATAALLAGGGLYGLDEEESIDGLLENDSKNVIVGQVERKLSSIERYVGYTKFNIISFDEAQSMARRIKSPFDNQEIAFIEELFYGNPNQYGFFGEKTVKGLT